MLFLIIFLTGVLIALGMGVLAAWSDIKGMTIPNLYSLVIAAAFVVTYGVLWTSGSAYMFASPLSHITGALIVFGVTAVMFALRAIGAADSKLAAAFALWMGVKGLFPFLFYMTLSGGILALAALLLKNKIIIENAAPHSWIGRVQAGESKVPYGVAIVLGALAAFLRLGYFNPAMLGGFTIF